MSSSVRGYSVTDVERMAINVAMETLETVLEATVWAVVATDAHGTFLWPRPDSEHAVMAYLATIDWQTAKHLAEEHIP